MINLDARLRYLPIVDFLKKYKWENESVLEVGGGLIGISKYIGNITACDPCLKDVENTNKVKYVLGDARELPFEDNSFDFVVSTDMVEHIKEEDRKKAIDEMIRVAKKYVIMGFPCGYETHVYEKRLFELGKKLINKEHKWIKEHVENGIPEEEEIREILKGRNYRVMGNSNLKLWFVNEIMNPKLWFIPWVFYPLFRFMMDKGRPYRKIFIVSK